jgi:hypothetical protein
LPDPFITRGTVRLNDTDSFTRGAGRRPHNDRKTVSHDDPNIIRFGNRFKPAVDDINAEPGTFAQSKPVAHLFGNHQPT